MTLNVVEKKRVAQSFDRAAPYYNRMALLQKRIGYELLGKLELKKLSCQKILDVGCGTGFCIEQLSHCCELSTYTALDIALGMLQVARSRLGKEVIYICAEAESIPLADHQFNVVISNLALQWCPNLDLVLSELNRILKPGGLLAFTTFGAETLNELREAWRVVDNFNHVNRFTGVKDIERSMKETGFDQCIIESQSLAIQYPSVIELMQELKGVGAHNVTCGRSRSLTGKGKIFQMIAAYEAMQSDKRIIANYQAIYAIGRKAQG